MKSKQKVLSVLLILINVILLFFYITCNPIYDEYGHTIPLFLAFLIVTYLINYKLNYRTLLFWILILIALFLLITASFFYIYNNSGPGGWQH